MVHLSHHVSEMITQCIILTRDMSRINIQVSPRNPLGLSRLDPKNMQIKENTYLSDTYLSHLLQRRISPLVHIQKSSKPSRALSDQDQPQHDPDPLFYREVAMADLRSQYAEEVETFRHILVLPDPRETMPRSSQATSVLGLDDKKGQQELRPKGPFLYAPISSHIKDAFVKFEQDFLASNLPEGKYIKPPPSTAKWYKVGQPCYEDKIRELNTNFLKICISPKPPGAPWAMFPYQFLRNWNIKLGRTSPLSTLWLHLPRLLTRDRKG